ncbi:MAG TPA: FAD-dependent oxidoreductase, partial [Solirubrobacteraceae bacterium]|nr:FAD-dependent oxidoreductase [Solirubrobacteraceae bacterium]
MSATTEPIGAGFEEPPDRDGAFPRLTEDQCELLLAAGRLQPTQTGDVLFRAGDPCYDFYVVDEGAVAIVQGYGRENRVIAVHGRHRFLGELNLLTGAPPFLSAVVRDPGGVIRVPTPALRALVSSNEELANVILRAYIGRRAILIEAGAGVKLVGSRYSPETQRLRNFLARNRMPYSWVDLETDAEAEQLLDALSVAPDETPVLLAGDGVMRNPSNAQVAAALGLSARGEPPALCDLVIVGGGPAGLAAAVYGASEGLDTQLIDKIAFGGQASTSARIENYLGFPTGISGSELAERAQLQARRFGARLVVPAQAVGLEQDDGHFAVALGDGNRVNGRTIIVATGAFYRKLDCPGYEACERAGCIYYAATLTEGLLCADQPVVVVGGGNSAGQAAMFLSQRASHTRLVCRGPDLGKSMSRYLINEIEEREQIEVLTSSEVVELHGEELL